MHPHVDPFFRIEQGEARFVLSETEAHPVGEGDAVVVPAGTYHNVLKTSSTHPLRLYTIYSPPHHPEGTVHKTKAQAEAAEAATDTRQHLSKRPATLHPRGPPTSDGGARGLSGPSTWA